MLNYYRMIRMIKISFHRLIYSIWPPLQVFLNRKRINLFMDPNVLRQNISEWKGAPCGPSHSVCGRGTVCEPRLNSAFCRCVEPPCEHAMQDNPAPDSDTHFDGKTLLKMKNMITTRWEPLSPVLASEEYNYWSALVWMTTYIDIEFGRHRCRILFSNRRKNAFQ